MAGDTGSKQARGHSNSKIIDGWPTPPLFLSGLWEPANERAAADGMQQPELHTSGRNSRIVQVICIIFFLSLLNSLHSVGFHVSIRNCAFHSEQRRTAAIGVCLRLNGVCVRDRCDAPFTQYELLRLPEVFHFNLIYWLQCNEHGLSTRSWAVCEWDGNGVKTNRKKIIKFKSSNNEMKMQFTRQAPAEHRTTAEANVRFIVECVLCACIDVRFTRMSEFRQ